GRAFAAVVLFTIVLFVEVIDGIAVRIDRAVEVPDEDPLAVPAPQPGGAVTAVDVARAVLFGHYPPILPRTGPIAPDALETTLDTRTVRGVVGRRAGDDQLLAVEQVGLLANRLVVMGDAKARVDGNG